MVPDLAITLLQIISLEYQLADKERQHRDTLELMKDEQNKVIKRLSLLEHALKR